MIDIFLSVAPKISSLLGKFGRLWSERERIQHQRELDSWSSWREAQEKRIELANNAGDLEHVQLLRHEYDQQLRAW
ncbi:MAG: hypothetical protein CMJ45_12420 [Planctomyces sp.]|nr:hypothetical protein [Planctomyces sp.]